MQSNFRRTHPSWRLPAGLAMLGLALGLPAFAGDPPAAPESAGGAEGPVAVQVGNATVRWHFAAAPREAAKIPLVERYRALVAARFTGDEVAPPEKAAIESPAAGARSSGSFSSRGMIRAPAEQFHTLFVGAGGAPAVCAKGGPRAKSVPAASEGEGR